jgi:hypothetical protein
MKSKLLNLLMVFVALISTTIFAQEVQMSGLKWSSGMSTFDDKGYYVFCQTKDDAESSSPLHRIRFMDYSYETKGEAVVEFSKLSYQGPHASNGQSMICSYLDPKAKIITVKTFDFEGKELGTKIFADSKQMLPSMHSVYPLIEITPSANGYVIMTAIRTGRLKQNCRLTCVDNNLNAIWTREFLSEENTIHPNAIHTDGEFCYFSYAIQELFVSNLEQSEQFILKIDAEGRDVFQYKVAGENYFMPLRIETLGEDVVIAGAFSKNGKSLGISVLKLSSTGQFLQQTEIDWNSKLKSVFPITDSRQKFNSQNPKYLIHDLLIKENGAFSLVIELIYSEASTSYAGGGKQTAGVKFIFGDFVIIDFATDLTFQNFSVIEKYETSVILGGTNDFEANQSYMQKYILKNASTYYRMTKSIGNDLYVVYKNFQKDASSSSMSLDLIKLPNSSGTVLKPDFTKKYPGENRTQIYSILEKSENSLTVYLIHFTEDKKDISWSISTVDVP